MVFIRIWQIGGLEFLQNTVVMAPCHHTNRRISQLERRGDLLGKRNDQGLALWRTLAPLLDVFKSFSVVLSGFHFFFRFHPTVL